MISVHPRRASGSSTRPLCVFPFPVPHAPLPLGQLRQHCAKTQHARARYPLPDTLPPMAALLHARAGAATAAASAARLRPAPAAGPLPGLRRAVACRVRVGPTSTGGTGDEGKGKDAAAGKGQQQGQQPKDAFGGLPPSDAQRLMPSPEQLASEQQRGGESAATGTATATATTTTGMVFSPMSEAAPILRQLDPLVLGEEPGLTSGASFARLDFAAELEAGLNEQIK